MTGILKALTLLMLCAASTSHALLISVDPLDQVIATGDKAYFDINISGLGDGLAPSVGAYDIDIGFNADILTFHSVSFGTGLDVSSFGSFQDITSNTGNVNLLEVAFAPEVFLDSLQPHSFTLATLVFDTIATGISLLTIDINSISDASGLIDLTSAMQTINGSIEVPEPPSLLILIFGLLFGVSYRIRSELKQ